VVFLCGRESVESIYLLFISVLALEIQLSSGKCWDPINRFNPVTILYPFQARTWISNIIIFAMAFIVFSE